MEPSADISDAKNPVAAAAYLLAAFAIGQALDSNNGNYGVVGLIWITLAILALAIAVFGVCERWLARVPMTKVAAAILVVQWSQLFVWGVGFRRAPDATATYFVGMLTAG